MAREQYSKPYQTFTNRIKHFDADVELVDIVNRASFRGKVGSTTAQYLFDDLDPLKNPTLAARTNNDHNRTLALNHLRSTIYTTYIKEIYEEVSIYLRELLMIAATSGINPNRLVGENKVNLTANEILSAGNWETIATVVMNRIFQQLENERSTLKLITKINDKLDLGVDETIITDALPYLEIRHLFVHSDGMASADFKSKYPSISVDPRGYVELNYNVISMAKTKIMLMIDEFENKAREKNYV